MLLADEPLEVLLNQLRRLPVRDRRAVLARLPSLERRQVGAALRALQSGNAVTSPSYAPDIVERISAPQGDTAMTGASREALAKIVRRIPPQATPAASVSLLGRVGAWMGAR